MILQTKQCKVFHILLNQLHASFILHGTTKVLITREQYPLGQKHLGDIKECGVAVHIKPNFVQNVGLLGYELVLFAVETHLLRVFAVERIYVVHVYLLLVILFCLAWFVSRQLSQKLSRARHMRIFLVILGRYKQAA